MRKKRVKKPFIQSVIYLQAHIRGYLVRKRIKNMKFHKKHSNGRKDEHSKAALNKAALAIQRCWRGHMNKKNREKSLERLQFAHFCQQV
jgi:hypothetical protein